MRQPVRTRVIAASALLLLAAACQSTDPEVTPTDNAASSPQGTNPAGQPTTAEPPAVEGEFEIGPGDFFLDDPRVGLEALASYTATLTVSFDGTADGSRRTWSKTYRLQHTSQPPMSVLTIEASGDLSAPDPRVLAEVSGASYELGVDGTCSSRPLNTEDSALALAAPAGHLPALMGAETAGSETMNGVAASLYTFDERAMLESGGPLTEGQIWIAADAGYLLKYSRTTTADAAYFGDGLDGTMTWDYGLSEVDALTSLELPGGCQLDAPIMAGATNVLVLARYAGFDTQSSIPDVIAFYKQEMPGLGWAVTSEPFNGEDTAIVEFGKDDLVITLVITISENGHRVDLALGSGD